MPVAAKSLRLPILLLTAALVLVAAAVVASLVSLHDPTLAVIIAVAGLAGILGGGFAYAVSLEEEPAPEPATQTLPATLPASPPLMTTIAATRAPVRIQSLPVADLPPAYLAAVMKGVQAHRAAREPRVLPGVGLRH